MKQQLERVWPAQVHGKPANQVGKIFMPYTIRDDHHTEEGDQ
jgi:hypothetical protein